MRKLLSFLFLFLFSLSVWAQQRAVSGRVTDANGNPLSGVTISVRGTNTATQSAADGSFTITASPESVLLISSVGFGAREVTVGTNETLSVTLQSQNTELSEVVVTALGIRRERKALGYSVEEVKGDQFARTNSQNLVNSLNGRVSGVQVIASGGAPGTASRVVIRGGAKSLTGNNEPLFVVDGIPVSNANDGSGTSTVAEGVGTPNRVADINPEDIESVSILKGSAASVLYGNRGANGVILITTKSGRGRAGVPVVTFSSTTGFDNPLVLPEYQTTFAQGNGNYAEGGSRSWGPRIQGQKVFSTAVGDSVILQAYNPRKDFLRTGVTFNNNLSLAQSRDNSSFFLSLGHSSQSSIIPNQEYNKASVRLNFNNQITSRLSTGVNLNYVRTWGDVPFLGQSGNNPFFNLFNMPISWDINRYGYVRPDGRQINFRGGSFDNPLWTVNKTFFNTTSDRIIGGVNFAYKITPWMDLVYRFGIDQSNDDRKEFRDIFSGPNPNGFLENDNINRQELTSTVLLNINRRLTEKFGLSFTGGQDFNQRKLINYTQTGTDLVIPGMAHMSNVEAFDPNFEFRSKRRLAGVFGDLKLDYRNIFFLGLSARNEWSSTLPEANNNYFYPGVNASLIFTDAFRIDKSIMSYGKVRAGFARTARDADPYQLQNTFAVPANTIAAGFGDGFTDGVSFPFNGIPGYTLNQVIKNPNLKPEFTSEIELGTEMRFLRDRIGLDFTYFTNKNTNGIVAVDISPATGASNVVVNSGETRVRGIEVGLNLTPLKTRDLNWNLYLTFSRIRSKVVETYPGVEQIYLGGFTGNPAIFAVKGERYGSIIGSGYRRNENGDVLVDTDGYPLTEDGVRLGYIEPDWTGGLRNSLNYKNFNLDFLIDVRRGGYLYNGTEELLDFYGVTKKTETREENYIFPGVKESDGKPNDVVVKRNANWWSGSQVTEEYVYENNWLRLREANLNYTLNLNRKVVKSLMVGVYGRNLWLSTDIPHVDPESSAWGTNNGQGATRMNFPSTRSLGFNLRFVF